MVKTEEVHDSTFEEHRKFLHSLAYRMVGSSADADDLVQDCYLRWRDVPAGSVATPKAYLATAMTRLSINHMQSARVRREQYVGAWLPEPILTSASTDPAELAESLTLAFLVLLESLSPTERAVFLLSQVFGYHSEEVAELIGASAANCRQILHRAKGAVAARRPRYQVARESVEPLLRKFEDAVYRGDVQGLVAMLHDGAVLYSDGGGKVAAAINPIHGADRIARFLTGIAAKGGTGLRLLRAELNFQPGIVCCLGVNVVSTIVFEIEAAAIRTIYITANPDKLRKIREEFTC